MCIVCKLYLFFRCKSGVECEMSIIIVIIILDPIKIVALNVDFFPITKSEYESHIWQKFWLLEATRLLCNVRNT